ncbi:MAG: THUMP domain-containing protein [Nanoarchaeota archaeon]|mgnify:FL=1
MNIATCLKGIEDITEKEVQGKKILPGRVEFSGTVRDFRSVLGVYEVLHTCQFTSLEDIEREAQKFIFPLQGSIRVDCMREGEHPFNSVDVEKIVSTVLRKQGRIIDFKNAEQTLLVDVVEDYCFFGIPLQRRLQKRAYRVKINNQGIHACLAYAMVQLAGYRAGNILIDPFCKDGTLLIEAGLTAPGTLHGLDQNKNTIRNAQLNAALAKVPVLFHIEHVDWLETLFKPKEVDCIASYPPFASKRRKPRAMHALYTQLFQSCQRLLKGKIVLLSPDRTPLHYAEGFRSEERTVHVGKQSFFLFTFYTRAVVDD